MDPAISDDPWTAIAPLLPPERAKPKGGRPPAPNRVALAGILLVLRTGMQWKEVSAALGCCGKTCWRRLQDWQAAGVWTQLHRVLLEQLHEAGGLDWSRAALGSASVPAKKGARRPARTRWRPWKLHADKGYDHRRCRAECRARSITPRIARRGIETSQKLGRHRWVVERTFAWLARFRRLTIRYERRADIHLALTTLACALICLKQIKRFCP